MLKLQRGHLCHDDGSHKSPAPLEATERLALMVSPFAPHLLGEECWSLLGHKESLACAPWVEFDEALCIDSTMTMGGKTRGDISIETDADQRQQSETESQAETHHRRSSSLTHLEKQKSHQQKA
jgi:leucyl-tRNA synthetase